MVRGAEQSGGAAAVCSAAAELLSPRFADLAHSVKKLAAIHVQEPRPQNIEASVHKVRVAARRVGVALSAFKNCCDEDDWAKARKLVRRVRRGAGVLRDADVHAGL